MKPSTAKLFILSQRSLRALAYMFLCLVMLAPKMSLAITFALGDGYRSVIICNGAGIQRVTVSADGQVVEDVSQEWVSSHCVMGADVNASLVQAWKSVSYPDFTSLGLSAENQVELTAVALLTELSNRGPPAQ